MLSQLKTVERYFPIVFKKSSFQFGSLKTLPKLFIFEREKVVTMAEFIPDMKTDYPSRRILNPSDD